MQEPPVGARCPVTPLDSMISAYDYDSDYDCVYMYVCIFSILGSCCTEMAGLFVAAFPRSNMLAFVLHGDSQFLLHGLGLFGGYCVFGRCSVSALPLVRPVLGGQPH